MARCLQLPCRMVNSSRGAERQPAAPTSHKSTVRCGEVVIHQVGMNDNTHQFVADRCSGEELTHIESIHAHANIFEAMEFTIQEAELARSRVQETLRMAEEKVRKERGFSACYTPTPPPVVLRRGFLTLRGHPRRLHPRELGSLLSSPRFSLRRRGP